MSDLTVDNPVSYAVHDGVAHIELNRPALANAFDLPMAREFGTVITRAGNDPAVRVLLLTGAGKRFCAGGDVSTFVQADDPSAYLRSLAAELDVAVRTLSSLNKPVVSAVQGAAAGAGLAVVLSCDVIVASASAKFVFAYPEIGLTPDCGTSYLLPRAVGQQRALEFALMRTPLGATRAVEWGMVTELVEGDPVQRARDICAEMAAGPAAALGQARRMLRGAWDLDRQAAGAQEVRLIGEMVRSPEAVALIEKFVSR